MACLRRLEVLYTVLIKNHEHKMCLQQKLAAQYAQDNFMTHICSIRPSVKKLGMLLPQDMHMQIRVSRVLVIMTQALALGKVRQ